MSRKKFKRWLDIDNRKTALEVSKRYYQNKGNGEKATLLNRKNIPLLVKRLFVNIARQLPIYRDKPQPRHSFLKEWSGIHEFEFPAKNQAFTPVSFKEESAPVVSIIIIIQDDLSTALNCLLSIFQNTRDVGYEIVLVNDCISPMDISSFTGTPEAIQYIVNQSPLGLIKSQNKASEFARGQYLCFLDGKAQVCSNWLSNMVTLFDSQTNTGLVGPKLVYPYGLLKAAGGLILPDSIVNYGEYEDPDHYQFNYLKETDFCPGTCQLILKDDFNKLNRFDPAFGSGACGPVDLSLSVFHHLGKKICYQPLSTVIDFSDRPSFAECLEKLRNKWPYLAKVSSASQYSHSNKTADKKKTILFIDEFMPEYNKNSGSRRIFELIKIFISLNFKVMFLANDGKKSEPYFSELVNLGVHVIYPVIPFRNPVTELSDIIEEINIAWISRPELNIFYGPFIQRFPAITWIYDTVDLHFVRIQREADLTKDPKLFKLAAETKNRELSIAKQADITVAITGTESETLKKASVDKVIVVPNIHEIVRPNTVQPFEKREGLLFIGGYDHTPNVDAVKWLVNEIMPELWKVIPSMNLTLLGSNPPQQILDYRSERIKVTGFIADVSPYFEHSRVFVAPLRYGAGMKGKIGQSLEYGLPIVSTSIGVEGMGLAHGYNILVADTTPDFVSKVLDLYNSPELWNKIQNNSVKALEEYTPEVIREKLNILLKEPFMDKKDHLYSS